MTSKTLPPCPVISLVIPYVTQSGNTYLRQHWSKRRLDKRRWGFLIIKAVGNSENMARYRARGPRSVTITRFGKRAVDLDNLSSGAKGLIDELRAHGLLLNDDPKSMVSLTVANGKLDPKQEPYMIIELRDAP